MDWRCGSSSRAPALLYKCEGLSSNPSPIKKKRKKEWAAPATHSSHLDGMPSLRSKAVKQANHGQKSWAKIHFSSFYLKKIKIKLVSTLVWSCLIYWKVLCTEAVISILCLLAPYKLLSIVPFLPFSLDCIL
jgi:hypothetical protein